MQNGQEDTKSPKLWVVPVDRATRIFRWMSRIVFRGLLTCISRRHPEVDDFDQIEIASEEIIFEEFESGQLVRRHTRSKKNYTIPTIVVATAISATAYYFLI